MSVRGTIATKGETTMTKAQRIRAARARDDARAETRMKLGLSANAYSGRTSATIDDRPTFRGRGAGGIGRSRRGRTERTRDGGLRFVPFRDAEPTPRVPARSYGGPIGDALVPDTQASLVSRPASMPRSDGAA
jgi:hypothetical protein